MSKTKLILTVVAICMLTFSVIVVATDFFDKGSPKIVVQTPVEQSEPTYTYVENDEYGQVRLYVGEPIEENHMTGAVWGDCVENVSEYLHDTYRTLDYTGYRTRENILFQIGLLGKPWEAYYDFNEKDELYRIDMAIAERVVGEEEERDYLQFLIDLLDGLYAKYGNRDAVLYRTESTVDYEVVYDDLSTYQNLQLFQQEDLISILYGAAEMKVWLVVLRENYEDATEPAVGEDKAGNILNSAGQNRNSLQDIVNSPSINKYSEFNLENEGGTLLARNRDSIYSIYIGFINSRFEPRNPNKVSWFDEADDPTAYISSDGTIQSDNQRKSIDELILNQYGLERDDNNGVILDDYDESDEFE